MTDETEHPEKILVRIDPDLADLIPGYLANRRKDVETIHDAIGKKDFETILVLGHRMKGDGGGYGFTAISDIGLALEEAARSQDRNEVRRCVDQLDVYLQRVEVEYR